MWCGSGLLHTAVTGPGLNQEQTLWNRRIHTPIQSIISYFNTPVV